LTERRRRGKWFSIVAVAEGAVPKRAAPVAAAVPAAVAVGKGGGDKKKKKDKDKDRKRKGEANGKPTAAQPVVTETEVEAEGRAGLVVAKAISKRLGIETRVTVLGHLQRGGIPTPFDRILATRFGTHAAELLARGEYNRMVCLHGSEVTAVPLEQVAGKLKLVPPDHALIRAARRVGTNFGD
jgi:6-phosphofructokinase 1